MVRSCGTRNLTLSSGGRDLSLGYRSTITCWEVGPQGMWLRAPNVQPLRMGGGSGLWVVLAIFVVLIFLQGTEHTPFQKVHRDLTGILFGNFAWIPATSSRLVAVNISSTKESVNSQEKSVSTPLSLVTQTATSKTLPKLFLCLKGLRLGVFCGVCMWLNSCVCV